MGTGKRDHVGDLFNFALLHPAIFREVSGGIGVGKEFADGCEAGAAVGEVDDVVGVEFVLAGPAGPNAGDGRGGVDEDAVHVDKQSMAKDGSHQVAK